MRTVVNSVARPWDFFVEAIVARELPSWDELRDDFMKEETQRSLAQGSTSNNREDEENVAFTAKGKKKSKKGPK